MGSYNATWIGKPSPFGSIKLQKFGAEELILKVGDCIICTTNGSRSGALVIKQFNGSPAEIISIGFTNGSIEEFYDKGLKIEKCPNINPPVAAGGYRRRRNTRRRNRSRKFRSRSRRS